METTTVWYNNPLFVALVTIFLTLLTTQGSNYLNRCIQRRRKSIDLKVAFHGEIEALRELLSSHTKTAHAALQSGKILRDYTFYYPNKIFEANASLLGEIGDAVLVSQIAQLYSALANVSVRAERMQTGIYDKELGLKYLVRDLMALWDITIILDIELSSEVEKIISMPKSFKQSPTDTQERTEIKNFLKEQGWLDKVKK